MRPPDIDATLVALRAADPDVMERDDLVALTRQIAAVKAWCDALQVRATRRLRALADEGRAEAPRDVLGRDGRESSKNARTADDRERVCTAMPGFEDALASGAVAAGHVDAIAAATRNLDEQAQAEFAVYVDDLLTDAQRQGVDVFERNCRELARHVSASKPGASDAEVLDTQRKRSNIRRWTDRETGMCHTHIELDPVRDRVLHTAIAAARARLKRKDGNRRTPWPQLEVDAVIEAIGGGRERVPEISLIVDDRTRCHGQHADSICEASDGHPVPLSTVRRLCCDAEIAIVHLGGHREVLGIGRAQRTANRAQRRALRAMHRTCAHPDCTVGFDDCRIHHVTFWRLGGRTDLTNMVPLCETHHHLVHEGGWTLTMTADRLATWTRPDGRHHHTGSTIDRLPSQTMARHEPRTRALA